MACPRRQRPDARAPRNEASALLACFGVKRPNQRDFDRRLWRRFWRIAKLYWLGEEKWRAYWLLLLLVVLLLGRTEFTVLFNEQSGEFTSALAARDSARF